MKDAAGTGGRDFDSAWFKWANAARHAQALDVATEQFALDNSGKQFARVTQNYDAKRHGFPLVIDEIDPIPQTWRLMLGDVMNNLRCALDHLAWALVQRGSRAGTLTRREERQIYFPIAKSSNEFTRLTRTRLPGVSRADQAIIQRGQPYRKGKRAVQWHYLSILDRMSNEDKHREVQGLWLVPDHSEYTILNTVDCVERSVSVKGRRKLLEVGAEIGFIYVRKTGPNPQIQVDLALTVYPAFNERLWLRHWLHLAVAAVMLLLVDFADAPANLGETGIAREWINDVVQSYSDMARIWAVKGRGVPQLSGYTAVADKGSTVHIP